MLPLRPVAALEYEPSHGPARDATSLGAPTTGTGVGDGGPQDQNRAPRAPRAAVRMVVGACVGPPGSFSPQIRVGGVLVALPVRRGGALAGGSARREYDPSDSRVQAVASASSRSRMPSRRARAAGSRTGVITSTRRRRLRGRQSADPM